MLKQDLSQSGFSRDRDATQGPLLSAMDRSLELRLLTPGRIGLGLAACGLVALATLAYLRYGVQRLASVDNNRVTISEVTFGRFREYIPVSGNIVPRTTVYLDAVEGGQVTAVRAEAGKVVAAGDPLLTLKNTNLQLEVIGREAQLTEQLNNLSATTLAFEQNRLRHRRELIDIDYAIALLERDLGRRRPLAATGAAAESEIEDLEAELEYRRKLRGAVEEARRIDEESQATQIETLRGAVSVMNRNLSIARENLDNLVVTAPIAGQLTVFDANVGESKAPGQRIGQLDELGAFKVSAFIDEFYLTRVAIGQVAALEIGGKTVEVEVAKIYPDVRNRQFEVDLTFVGATPDVVRRGQTVRMRLEIGQAADSILLANGKFFEDTGGSWVFAVGPEGKQATRRDVRFGRRNPEGIEVIEGLRQGERVITSTYAAFLDADRLELRSNGE